MSETPLRLTGYGPSVYTWIARLALTEAGAAFEFVEVDPFTETGQAALLGVHPFGRVPVLDHGTFQLSETVAILDYVDGAFAHGRLTPTTPKARAQMRQVIGIVDAYGYWPLIRQVFAHRVFAPLEGEIGDEDMIADGLGRATAVLDALEGIAGQGRVLSGPDVTLADIHLAPMLDTFARAPEGTAVLARYPALAARLEVLRRRPSFVMTRPLLRRTD